MKIITLKNKAQFDRVYKEGKSFANRNLIFYYIKNNTNSNRYGIVISAKVAKAHIRNYLRRIIKEHLRKMDIKKGYDMIIIVRAKVGNENTDYKKMGSSLTHIFKKNGLMKESTKTEKNEQNSHKNNKNL